VFCIAFTTIVTVTGYRKVAERKKVIFRNKVLLVTFASGLFVGLVLSGLVLMAMMPSMMIITKESTLGFDETVAALEKSITDHGWVVADVKDMNKALSKQGVEFAPRVKLIKFCNAEYASDVLATDRYISTMMPCTCSVWEDDDGKIYLSKMNMSLMGKLFGGNIARVMGGSVAKEEADMLSGILKD